ncbi:MAG: DUF927 domain-containing protein [Bacillota bacterium]
MRCPTRRSEVLKAAIQGTLQLLELASDPIILPLFCVPWRAALGCCDFGLHVSGPSGVFKSELASLIQRFFGSRSDARHLRASWSSTDNALEALLFWAKDTLLVVDDFAPNGGPTMWHAGMSEPIGFSAPKETMPAEVECRPTAVCGRPGA